MSLSTPVSHDTETSTVIEPPVAEQKVVVSVQDVSKRYCRDLKKSLWFGLRDIASELLARSTQRLTLKKAEFWALKDINFEVCQGRAVGLVGRNGSGKTTLMKILAGLIKPTTGSIYTRGRVAPLLALGAGFNPILTGRENVFVNLLTLGLSKEEISDRFEDIVNFSEVEYALDAPVQSYSSGMAARLGFACAIHTYPEILLLDEVLAVGDMKFIMKCFSKLHEIRAAGTSFILVNHNPQAILGLCDTAIYLGGGKMISSGAPEGVMDRYKEDMHIGATADELTENPKSVRKATTKESVVEPLDVVFLNGEGQVTKTLYTQEPGALEFSFNSSVAISYANTLVEVMPLTPTAGDGSKMLGEAGQPILFFDAELDDSSFKRLSPGKHRVRLNFPQIAMVGGLYQFGVKLFVAPYQVFEFDQVRVHVKTRAQKDPSLFYQPHTWTLESTDGPE